MINKWVVYCIGFFVVAAACFNWDWFFNHPKAQFFVDVFGRNGTRAFYAVIGIIIVILGYMSC